MVLILVVCDGAMPKRAPPLPNYPEIPFAIYWHEPLDRQQPVATNPHPCLPVERIASPKAHVAECPSGGRFGFGDGLDGLHEAVGVD